MKLLLNFLAQVAGLLGTIAAYDQLKDKMPAWMASAFVVVIALIVIGLLFQGWEAWNNRPRKYPPNSPLIAEELSRGLTGVGNAAIFTRDLTWASAPGSPGHATLMQKAANSELTVVCELDNGFAKALSKAGAMVFSYKGVLSNPGARFTILDYGKAGARLVIGYNDGTHHVIREYRASEDPALICLAQDMIRLASSVGKKV